MTADTAGKATAAGLWATLKLVKEQWVLVMFVTGALFWARDTWEEFRDLPAAIAAERGRVTDLAVRVAALETDGAGGDGAGARAVLAFPGHGHSATDAGPGGRAEIRLSPVVPLASDCVPVGLDAFVVDVSGRWVSAQASIAAPPALDAPAELGFALEIPPGLPAGRASAEIGFVHDCGGDLRVSTVPRLPFRILAD